MADVPRVVLTGGLSGGHTFPLIAVARALRSEFPQGIEFLFIGSRGRFEDASMAEESIPVKYVLTGKWRRYFSLLNIIDPFKIPIGFVQALWHMLFFMPEVIFAKGGAASVPVVVAAWLYRIPVVIHDSDAVAGRANRFLSRFARRIAIAYPGAREYFPAEKTALTGNPVRTEILSGDAARAFSRYGFSAEKSTLLVIGGSQGAMILNEALLRVLPSLLERNIQVIHQTGSDHYESIKEAVEKYGIAIGTSGYVPVPFLPAGELADALSAAMIVISRAGAGSIAEIAATKKPAILIPLASAANDEQRMNAYDIAGIGGALVIEEANLGKNMLFEKIVELIDQPGTRVSMSEKIGAFYHPDAAQAIAESLATLIRERRS